MTINKTNIFLSYVTLKSSIYIWGRQEDFQHIYNLIIENQYAASIEKLIELTLETMEYVVQINL